MKDNAKPNAGSLREDDRHTPNESGDSSEAARDAHFSNGSPRPGKFDAWTALDLVTYRWHWVVVGALVCGVGFYLLGWYFIRPKFVASAQLLRYEAPGKSDFFKTAPLSSETFAAMMRSPELLRVVAEQAVPPISEETLGKSIRIDPVADSDMVKVQLAAREPRRAVDLLNLYAQQVVAFTKKLEREQAGVLANDYLKKQVDEMQEDINNLQTEFLKLGVSPQVSHKLAEFGGQLNTLSTNLSASPRPSIYNFSLQAQRLQTATTELQDLLVKYTDLNPLVQAKRDYIKDLERQLQQASTNGSMPAPAAAPLAAGPSGGPMSPQEEIIHIKLRALEDSRLELLKRQREADLYAQDPPGNVRIFARADLAGVKTNLRRVKISLVTIVGAGLGCAATVLLVLLVEFLDNRVKTADDIRRVTQLDVLASLGDLNSMGPEARAQWAFRAWTMLQGRLSPSPNFGLVCGVTSSTPGEGRSTWISLLAEAASMTGFRVLTIATRPSPTHVGAEENLLANVLNAADPAADARPKNDPPRASGNGHNHALTTSVLSSPGKVTEQLTGPNSQPVVHIPLPGWVWNLERRKQWREALVQWRQIDNLVILVELPPASVPEAVLLGSNLPNMLWLADSGSAHAGETRAQLKTLRDARCNLVGAVLNRRPSLSARERFPRWMGCVLAFAIFGAACAHAQDSTNPPAASSGFAEETGPRPGSFSIDNPARRSDWQRRLTLGPGDVLTFSLYGQPDSTRAELPIGPDGRVNYLQATNVLATGLTIDELRAKMDEQLGLFIRSPHTIIMPVAFKSKKYYMLGKVTTKGVYTLDRPLTVLEALARAHGLESALVDRNIVGMTDFQRSFLARGGKRYPLNFEKLFERGDLSQNIPVEPGDYIYFAAGDVNEVYVVGEIRSPGPVTYTPDMTIISAIAGRGGYTDRAFRTRVLVIRGPLDNPEKYAVNTHAILDAMQPDFKLRPKDIIYVNSRPFIKVEEAADLAATAFIQSIITSWVGVDVVKPIP